MLGKKSKSILDYTWVDLLKKIENKDCIDLYVGYDCLDVFINVDKVISVSHPKRVSKDVSKLLADISACCKDLESTKLPLHLKILGPGCAQYVRSNKFYIVCDPIKKKAIHSFYGRVGGAKVIEPEYLDSRDIISICSSIRKIVTATRGLRIRSPIRRWISDQIKKDKKLSEKEKAIFEKLLEQKASGKSLSEISASHRNDMQERRMLSRLNKEFVDHLARITFPLIPSLKKVILTKADKTCPAYVHDKVSEVEVFNIKTQIYYDEAQKISLESSKNIISVSGLENLDQNPICTLMPGVLFIFKEPLVNINFDLLVPLWTGLEDISMKG